MTPILDVGRRKILTVEGVTRSGGRLSPLQQAFVDADALQCGYCTPGFLMSAAALLRHTPKPTQEEIAAALNGNLCRCGSQPHIVAAIAKRVGR